MLDGIGPTEPMIVALANTKGGVGKTTLAVNLAVALSLAGRKVLLVDGDEQGTAAAFTDIRTEENPGGPGYAAVRLRGRAVHTQVKQLAGDYDDIVIDVGGRDTAALRAALTISDVALIPLQPRSFDLWALDQMAELVEEARGFNPDLRALAVLNAADPQGNDNEETAGAVKDVEGIDFLPAFIVRRKAFANAASNGQSVLEQRPRDAKAVEELQSLIGAVFR